MTERDIEKGRGEKEQRSVQVTVTTKNDFHLLNFLSVTKNYIISIYINFL